MNTAIPIVLIGCEHNGATEADFSPIAWPAHAVGTSVAGGLRTANLAASTFRQVWVKLPPRTRVNSTGRVVIATAGKQTGGTLVLPDYQVFRVNAPLIDQTDGDFTTSGSSSAMSLLVNDVHTSGNWTTLPPLLTNIDLTTDHTGSPLAWFGRLALRIRAPYTTGGGAAGMYVTGLAVQNW